jgi:hypothetical protein
MTDEQVTHETIKALNRDCMIHNLINQLEAARRNNTNFIL